MARSGTNHKGGGRKGYAYEHDQLIRLRKLVDRGIAKVEAIEKGRLSELANDFPEYSDEILNTIDRLKDLMIPFRERWYQIDINSIPQKNIATTIVKNKELNHQGNRFKQQIFLQNKECD